MIIWRIKRKSLKKKIKHGDFGGGIHNKIHNEYLLEMTV
jgi:hypothetical protein